MCTFIRTKVHASYQAQNLQSHKNKEHIIIIIKAICNARSPQEGRNC